MEQAVVSERIVYPMLLTSLKKTDIGQINPNEYLCYEKFDGFRCVWNKGILTGRSNENFSHHFPEIVKALQPYKDCIFDGELVNRGLSKSHILQKRMTTKTFHIKIMSGMMEGIPSPLPVTYMIFDILEKGGQDLRLKPFEERQKILKNTLTENEWLQMVKPIEKPPQIAFNEVIAEGKEGIVLKKKESPYIETISDKRTEYWIKAKNEIEEILKFTSYEVNPVGITLINPDGIRCACNGWKHKEVKEQIDSKGYAHIEVAGLEATDNKKIRQIVYRRLIR